MELQEKKERKTIGFKFYETSEVAVVSGQQDQSREMPLVGNPYFEVLIKSINEFLQEEIKGQCFTELRLMKKIKCARELFGKEKELLGNLHTNLLERGKSKTI